MHGIHPKHFLNLLGVWDAKINLNQIGVQNSNTFRIDIILFTSNLNPLHPMYASMPRWSLPESSKLNLILIILLQSTDLCACRILVDLDNLDGFPMKSSCCWQDVAKGDNCQTQVSASCRSSRAVWHNMWFFGYIGYLDFPALTVRSASTE